MEVGWDDASITMQGSVREEKGMTVQEVGLGGMHNCVQRVEAGLRAGTAAGGWDWHHVMAVAAARGIVEGATHPFLAHLQDCGGSSVG